MIRNYERKMINRNNLKNPYKRGRTGKVGDFAGLSMKKFFYFVSITLLSIVQNCEKYLLKL